MTRGVIAAYVAVWLLVGWPLATSMFVNESRVYWQEAERDFDADGWWVKHRRETLGQYTALGFLYGAIWPVGVPLAFAMTGFAEHGIWPRWE